MFSNQYSLLLYIVYSILFYSILHGHIINKLKLCFFKLINNLDWAKIVPICVLMGTLVIISNYVFLKLCYFLLISK